MTFFERMKHKVQQLVEKLGSLESLPVPVFPIHCLTWQGSHVDTSSFHSGLFFGATLIGKAVIKMHIQKVFVILAFNNQLIETLISLIVKIPVIGDKLEAPVRAGLAKQKEKLRGGGSDNEGSIISAIFEKFVLLMVAYFVVSIINSLAQSYAKRKEKQRKEEHTD